MHAHTHIHIRINTFTLNWDMITAHKCLYTHHHSSLATLLKYLMYVHDIYRSACEFPYKLAIQCHTYIATHTNILFKLCTHMHAYNYITAIMLQGKIRILE